MYLHVFITLLSNILLLTPSSLEPYSFCVLFISLMMVPYYPDTKLHIFIFLFFESSFVFKFVELCLVQICLLSQVNSLRQELQILASNRPVTIVTGRGSGYGCFLWKLKAKFWCWSFACGAYTCYNFLQCTNLYFLVILLCSMDNYYGSIRMSK